VARDAAHQEERIRDPAGRPRADLHGLRVQHQHLVGVSDPRRHHVRQLPGDHAGLVPQVRGAVLLQPGHQRVPHVVHELQVHRSGERGVRGSALCPDKGRGGLLLQPP